jgi:hypothetical protein
MPFAGITLAGVGSALAGGAAAAAGGALASDVLSSGGSSGGGQQAANPYGQVAQGVSNIAGGALSAVDAQNFANQLAQTANPFGQYNQQFGGQLANASAVGGQFGNGNSAGQNAVGQYASDTTNFLPGATNPVNQAAQQGQQGLNSLNLGGINSQINNLIQNPGSIYNTPQYQAAFGQGSQAVNSTLAAQGLNASGNQLAALQSYGQQFGQNAYNTQLSQLSGLSGQAASQQQQGFGQLQSAAQTNLAANQQGFNQLQSVNQSGLATNQQGFSQLAQLSGLSSGSPTAAAAAQAQVYGNVNSAYGSVGQGIGQLASGAGNILNGLGNTGTGTVSGYTGDFNSGLGTSTSGSGISGSGALYGTSAGQSGADYTYDGSNSWGFTG